MTKAKDLTYFLSTEAASRQPSPLKTAFKYFGNPDIVFLGGGLPLSDYFPWNKIVAESPKPPFVNGIGAAPSADDEKTIVDLSKHIDDCTHADDIPLSRALQYGYTQGHPELQNFLIEHTRLIHKIPYEDWDVICTVGNTQSWDSTLRTLTNKGDTILVEEFTFSSALETANAVGVTQFPVPMDNYGIIPEKLEELLEKWVGKKPKLLYTICTGQNPTGSSLSNERREKIYKIAQKYDFIIVEDEPYYFLQMDNYTTDKSKRTPKTYANHQEFIDALTRSFLAFDVDGRVLRLDSFSKVLAPGTRLGWIVGQKNLLERFVRLHEVSIQNSSGFTQALVNGTLTRWGQSGYLDWLIGLRSEYTHKRDVAIDAVDKFFDKSISSYCPPVAGMFFTVKFDASKHPKFETDFGKDPLKVENALYEAGLKQGALLIPGSWFKVTGQTNPPQPSVAPVPGSENTIFFRGTYAAVPLDKLVVGIERFGKAASIEFGLE